MKRTFTCTVALTLTAICCGCGGAVKTTKNVPATEKMVAKDATLPELLGAYNDFARSIKTLNATVELKPTTGSQYSGVIEEYHEVKAFLLAKRPADIRMIGQAPVIGKTVFDMASDGETFRVSIPSKQKFLVGPVVLEHQSDKPIENLRPQHLLEGLLWPEIHDGEQVLFEEFNDESGRYYVLDVVRGGGQTEIARKVWFNRADLQLSRIETFGPQGALLSDVHFSEWKPLTSTSDPAAAAAAAGRSNIFPRRIRIDRPHDDYRLEMEIMKITLNQDIPEGRFQLEQPPGTELVRLSEEPAEKKP